ncbi:hypothetical protein ACP8HI_08175 [Paenibacillus sp. FA6]|uniref:hypothetical protein n=1 Tax=Paenibacillus sp. FA6 TaxID=3413029 RepID=UPI003F65B153
MKKKKILKRYPILAVGLIAIVVALIMFVASPFLSVNSNNSLEKFHVVDGLTIEEGAQIKIRKNADLFGSMKEATIALINLPLIPEQDYAGYVGIWDSNGKLVQKFVVKGYHIMNPVQIHVQDITGDGNSDIVVETDEHVNGGLGVHALHVYVENKGQYTEAPLSEEINSDYTVTFRSSSKDFIVISTQDNRRWTVQLGAEQLKHLNSNVLNQSNPVNVDPISSIDVHNNTLTTKRLIWFGDLQLNSLAVLESNYYFEENKWEMQSYSLENIDKSTIVTEIF